MAEEWEDDIWEYTQGGDFYDEDQYEEEGEREEQEDEDERAEHEIQEERDDIEFAPEFKQLQQVRFERRAALGTAALTESRQKTQRSPEEATLDQVEGVISSTYSNISENLHQKIISRVEKIKGVYLYNVDVLVLAVIWDVEGKELNKKNLRAFMTNYKQSSDVNVLDLIRYIRTLSTR